MLPSASTARTVSRPPRRQAARGRHTHGAAVGQLIGTGRGQFAVADEGVAAVGLVVAAEEQAAGAGLFDVAAAADGLVPA